MVVIVRCLLFFIFVSSIRRIFIILSFLPLFLIISVCLSFMTIDTLDGLDVYVMGLGKTLRFRDGGTLVLFLF